MSTLDLAARSGESVKAGPIGLAVILLLAIACYFLFKSMSKHMRIVRESFPDDPSLDPTRGPVATDGVDPRADRVTAARAAYLREASLRRADAPPEGDAGVELGPETRPGE